VKATISGDKDVIKAFKDIGLRKAKSVIRSTIHAQASDSVRKIRPRAPVFPVDVVKYAKAGKKKITRRGTLRRAIKAKGRKPRNDNYQSNVIVEHGNDKKNDAYYWHFVEYGTVKMSAKPFIRPVEVLKKQTAEGEIKTEFLIKVEKAINQAVK
jgi:HK97 gp10 family phage protein